MNAYHLLTVLKDARDEGLWREQSEIVEQLGVDVAHVRFEVRNRPLMPRAARAADWEDEGDGEQAPAQADIDVMNRASRVRTALEWKSMDWMSWMKRATVMALADLYKRMYSDVRVADLTSERFVLRSVPSPTAAQAFFLPVEWSEP